MNPWDAVKMAYKAKNKIQDILSHLSDDKKPQKNDLTGGIPAYILTLAKAHPQVAVLALMIFIYSLNVRVPDEERKPMFPWQKTPKDNLFNIWTRRLKKGCGTICCCNSHTNSRGTAKKTSYFLLNPFD
jgi:hypothetical protein